MNVRAESHQPFTPPMEAVARVAAIRRRLETPGLEAVVVGAGQSGQAAVELLVSRGARVTLADDRCDEARSEAARRLRVPLMLVGAAGFSTADLVVLSPGFPRSRPELAPAIERQVLVGEVELASWFIQIPLVGVTGTNGKSTTTALVAHLLRAAGLRVFSGGNLGPPLSALPVAPASAEVAVVELSSYQLESIVDARFEVACWLNLSPDHLDRYGGDVELYAAAKERILARRAASGVAILNAKDPICSDRGIRRGGPIRWFSAEARSNLAATRGTRMLDETWAERTVEERSERYVVVGPGLLGAHNRANACAAIECVRHFAVDPLAVSDGLATFPGLPHRLERVAEIRGVQVFNDSKATNIDSAITAVRAISGPKVLILGGRDKGAPWEPLVAACEAEGVKGVLAIGEAEDLVVRSFEGRIPLVEGAGDLRRAFDRALELSSAGDSVLLSPACASFDQFASFEHRGDCFRAIAADASRGQT